VALAVALFSVAFFADRIAAAHLKPFWHDEIFTTLLARLDSIRTMWQASLDGVDFMPPLNGFITHAVHALAGDGPVITRLPAMVGVWLACLAIFTYVRQRSNLVLALGAAILTSWTAAFLYAVEARGYGLMLGCFGISMVAWTQATRMRQRRLYLPLLALSLAAGAWAHYYAVLNAAALGTGQLVRDVRRRAVDAGVWTAFAAAGGSLLPLVPATRAAMARTGQSWTLIEPPGVQETYASLFRPLMNPWLLGAVIMLVALGRLEGKLGARPLRHEPIPLHEIVAGVACLLIPLAGLGARAAGIGVFVPRYGLCAVVAFCAAAPLALWIASGRSRTVALVVCAWLSFGLAHSAWGGRRAFAVPAANPVATRPLLLAALERGEHVCVTGGLVYLQYWYYTPPARSAHLCYLADPATARRVTGSDSLDEGLLHLRRWSAISVHDYNLFVVNHPTFTVYAAGSGWLLERLWEAGADVRETGVDTGGFRMYSVSVPPR
jgi:hypothetical protein